MDDILQNQSVAQRPAEHTEHTGPTGSRVGRRWAAVFFCVKTKPAAGADKNDETGGGGS